MITQAIIILIAVLVGWFLRDWQEKRIRIDKIIEVGKEAKKKFKKTFLPDRSGMVEWLPPKSEEEIAEEKVRRDLNG